MSRRELHPLVCCLAQSAVWTTSVSGPIRPGALRRATFPMGGEGKGCLVAGGVRPATRTLWFRTLRRSPPLSPHPSPRGGKGAGGDLSELLRDPEAGGPGAGVRGHLDFGGPHGMPCDDAKGGPVAAGADWLLGWADAVFGLDVEE